jgi:hypothetical protein
MRAFYSPNSPTRLWVLFIIVAAWILWGFGYDTVWQRLGLQLDGTVISSRDDPATGAARYVTYYVVRTAEGHEQRYVAGPTDSSLERSMPIGTRIHKEPGQLDYYVNGRRVGFPTAIYGGILAFAALLVLAGSRGWWNELKSRPGIASERASS